MLELGATLAEAQEGIHGAEVVHRDLKPSNVLLADGGSRVIGFGISLAAWDTKLTLTGTAVGTPGYMPPVQLVGEDVGPAGDVFALGAVLAYTSTGITPFAGGSAHGGELPGGPRGTQPQPRASLTRDGGGPMPRQGCQAAPVSAGTDRKAGPVLGGWPYRGRVHRGRLAARTGGHRDTRIQDTPLPDTAPGTLLMEAPATVTAAPEQATAGAVPPTAVATVACQEQGGLVATGPSAFASYARKLRPVAQCDPVLPMPHRHEQSDPSLRSVRARVVSAR